MADHDYRPGLVFTSPAAGFQFIVQGAEPTFSPSGVVIARQTELTAEFGVFGDEYTWEAGNEQGISADIRGGYFDLDLQAEQKGWSDDDRALVARRLLMEESRNPDYFLYSKPVVAKPWPTYETTHHNTIPELAVQLGLTEQTLAYERDTKNRASVVEKLEHALAGPRPAATDSPVFDEELTAA